MRPHPGCGRPLRGRRNIRHKLIKDRAVPRTWPGGLQSAGGGGLTSAYPYRPDPYNKAETVVGRVSGFALCPISAIVGHNNIVSHDHCFYSRHIIVVVPIDIMDVLSVDYRPLIWRACPCDNICDSRPFWAAAGITERLLVIAPEAALTGKAQRRRRCYRPAASGPRRSISGIGPPPQRRRYVAPFRTFMTSAGRKQARQVPPVRRTLG